MSKTLLIDLERGTDSIQGRIASGDVIWFPANGHDDVERAFWALKKGKPLDGCKQQSGEVYEADLTDVALMALDSTAAWVNNTFLDIGFKEAYTAGKTTWSLVDEFGDARHMYNKTTNLVKQVYRYIRSLDIPTIFTAGEDTKETPLRVSMNPALQETFEYLTDALLHMMKAPQDIKWAGGVIPEGTRMIGCADNSVYRAKGRFPENIEPVPFIYPDPTIEDIKRTFGGTIPKRIVVYGPAGVGKTRFATSLNVTKEKA
jgi:hypothetical protein